MFGFNKIDFVRYSTDETFFQRFFRLFNQCNIPMLAKGMVYATLVAIVPCMAILVLFFSFLGLPDRLFEIFSSFVVSTFGSEIGTSIEHYIELFTRNSLGLGITGLLSFFVTLMILIDNIWISMNRIYEGKTKNISKRYLKYFVYLLIFSVLFALIVFVQGKVYNVFSFIFEGSEVSGIKKIFGISIPYASLFILLWCMFRFMHSTGSCALSAFFGAGLCTFAIRILSIIFGYAVKYTVRYSIIYGSLASILLFLMFLSFSWYIIFTCAVFAHNVDLSIVPDEEIFKNLEH